MSQLEAPTAEFKITSANRQAVKDWLAAQGFDATRVQSMRDQTLLKAYTDPRYLRALTNRGDYNPSVERNGNANLHSDLHRDSTDHRADSGASKDADGRNTPSRLVRGGTSGVGRLLSEGDTRNNGGNLNSMAEAELSSAPAVPENTQGVTEARVVELIRALAVLKPGLEGLEDLL